MENNININEVITFGIDHPWIIASIVVIVLIICITVCIVTFIIMCGIRCIITTIEDSDKEEFESIIQWRKECQTQPEQPTGQRIGGSKDGGKPKAGANQDQSDQPSNKKCSGKCKQYINYLCKFVERIFHN